jgi:hypothetical protein
VGYTVTATIKVSTGTHQFGFTDLFAELFVDSFLVIPGFLDLAPLAPVEFFKTKPINKFISPKIHTVYYHKSLKMKNT